MMTARVLYFPRTANALRDWDGDALPEDSDDGHFSSKNFKIREEQDRAALALAVRRMNFDEAGFRGLMRKTARLTQEIWKAGMYERC